MNSDAGAGALEQFTILAKSAKGNACVALIQQVLSTRKIVVFGELLAMPNLEALRGSEHEPYLRLLEIFAYGTYADYQRQRGTLPPLTPPQLRKLQQLTLVTLAQKHENIPYAVLFRELDMDGDVRELEDLIIESINMGLLTGRLDQRGGRFRIKGAIGRDVRLEDIDGMMDKLQKWVANAETLLTSLEQRMSEIHDERCELDQQRQDYKEKLQHAKAHPVRGVRGGGGGAGGFGGLDDDDMESFLTAGASGGRRKVASEGRYKRKGVREPMSRMRNK
ncbi:cop9 signalosome complex subunit 7a [Nannochloropsis gaditana]|uniref:Cop9 signalosome complex subunit 7a n=1 Tax=Nannochloropsis gaditana TaxID=72520 RepID=W7TWL6_9STRA|nr:cop9 signalosome complex subunit 7a [Nannochloropsis gaditana]